MKYRFKLIKKYYNLCEKYEIKKHRKLSKYNDLNILIFKINKLVNLIIKDAKVKNYESILNKIHLLEYGFKKCECCGQDVLSFGSCYCSYSCASKMFHKNESEENKK